MDSGRCGVLLLLAVSAAFDTGVHDHLFRDLESIGIVDDALRYLRTYLETNISVFKWKTLFQAQILDQKEILKKISSLQNFIIINKVLMTFETPKDVGVMLGSHWTFSDHINGY